MRGPPSWPSSPPAFLPKSWPASSCLPFFDPFPCSCGGHRFVDAGLATFAQHFLVILLFLRLLALLFLLTIIGFGQRNSPCVRRLLTQCHNSLLPYMACRSDCHDPMRSEEHT